MIQIAAFTGGPSRPSSRFRIRQHMMRWRSHGVAVTDFSLPFPDYPDIARRFPVFKPLVASGSLAWRVPQLLRSRRYHLTIYQKPLLVGRRTLERLGAQPRLLDFDDAIWVDGKPGHVRQIAEMCDGVIVGNKFLAEHLEGIGVPLHVVATGVDIARIDAEQGGEQERAARRWEPPIIGWTGTWRNLEYLLEIEEALGRVMSAYPAVRVRVISDRAPEFKMLDASRVEFVRWHPSIELRSLNDVAIGIMPLGDSVAARGKCAFKMLQYMASSIPVVVSPVGMNDDVLKMGSIGCRAGSAEDWYDALAMLLEDQENSKIMGRNGRRVVERHFSSEIIAGQYVEIFERFANAGA